MKYETVLISGFPGVGKSYLTEKSNLKVSDSDSSLFPKDKFPTNYINHIKELMGGRHIIMISSHKEVRDALVKEGIKFKLAYPSKDQKSDYVERYKQRGSPQKFIELVESNFETWVEELENQKGCDHIVLKEGQYLQDALIEDWIRHSVIDGIIERSFPLTIKMQEAKDAVENYTKNNGVPPSYRDLAKILGVSLSAAHYRMKYLRSMMTTSL